MIALYSNFLPYFSLLSDVRDYNIAYYGAQTAVERSLSVLRYREAGFEWSGGWIDNNVIWPLSDYQNEYLSDKFRVLTREIQWRTDGMIPTPWQGNIEYRLLSWVSNDYNMLSYHSPLRLLLSVDNTQWINAYRIDLDNIIYYNWGGFEISLRLNPVIADIFDPNDNDSDWNLCNSIRDSSGDGITDDVVVDRGRKGKYNDGFSLQDFSIIPRNVVVYNSVINTWLVDDANDGSARERDINTMSTNNTLIQFTDTINPLTNFRLATPTVTGHLMIASQSLIDQIASDTFQALLINNNIIDQELILFLARLLETCEEDIYPFLEYKINYDTNGDSTYLPDPWFMIHGKSQVWWYTVNMYVRKSINKDDTLSSFTVVF